MTSLRSVISLFALAILEPLPAFAQGGPIGGGSQAAGDPEVQALVNRGDLADAQLKPDEALGFYLKASSGRPNNPAILLKIAKEYSDSTLVITDAAEDRRRIEKALDYSKRAAAIDPRSEVALLSIAICYGKLGLYGDTRERIGYVRLVKEYTDQALEVNPGYAYAHHVLGQWEYEVASLGRTKRFLVNLIYGGLPQASTEDAVRQLELAVRLEPNVAAHRLTLGFAYLANGEPEKARRSFEEVMAMPRRDLYDTDCHRRAERAIAGL